MHTYTSVPIMKHCHNQDDVDYDDEKDSKGPFPI